MDIKQIRQKYPQYSDMSDQQLADALYSKHYSDIPKEEFYGHIGLQVEKPEEQKTEARSDPLEFGAALLRGARGTAGAVRKGVMGATPLRFAEPLVDLASQYIEKNIQPDISPTQGEEGRFINTAGELAGGALAGGGASTVGRAATQVVLPALGGAVGEQIGGEAGKLIGALGVPAAATVAAALAKNAIARRVAPNLETFKQAGVTPTVGQASEHPFLQGLENLASKFPGGAKVMRQFIDSQQQALGAGARTRVPTEAAGRAIEKGITGQGGFLQRTKETWQRLDDELGARIPKDAAFQPSSTVQALDDLVKPVAGAEKTTAALVNPKIASIRDNLVADLQANNGVVPFQALRVLRSRIGEMLDDALVSGVPGGQIKKVYAALSDDIERAAQSSGAGQAFARQNAFYRARMARVEEVLERVLGKANQPEEIFSKFFPKDPDQANKVRAVMRSLDPAHRQTVSQAVVNRLGRAAPGKQDELGEVFSSETFLTNWNKMSQGAKAQLFPNHSMRQNLEKIAQVSANIRQGAQLYANPSGTAGSFAAYAVYTSPLVAAGGLMAGQPGALAVASGAAAAAGSAYLGAKMLTSPKVVEWLARPLDPTKAGAVQSHLARLLAIHQQSDDEGLRSEIEQFISKVSGQSAGQK